MLLPFLRGLENYSTFYLDWTVSCNMAEVDESMKSAVWIKIYFKPKCFARSQVGYPEAHLSNNWETLTQGLEREQQSWGEEPYQWVISESFKMANFGNQQLNNIAMATITSITYVYFSLPTDWCRYLPQSFSSRPVMAFSFKGSLKKTNTIALWDYFRETLI